MDEELKHLPIVATPPPPLDKHLEGEVLRPGIGLCMSGGGFRAMLFHAGVLWRLNEFGYLTKLDRISSVSGGSITAGVLALNWSRLAFNATGVAPNFYDLMVEPIRQFGSRTVDVWAILAGIFGPASIGDWIAKSYRRHLFGNKTLQDIPERPRFVINATNVQSGVLWRFSRPYMRDYRVGEVRAPNVELAVAVAASSAFPPVLSPVQLDLPANAFTPNSGADLQSEPYTTHAILTDGGVYDNLGLETVWKQLDTVLVSDAGGKMPAEPKPKRDWIRHSVRVLSVIDNQVRSLRKRQVIDSFKSGDRKGTYWGIRTNIADYDLDTALSCPFDKTLRLADLPTRLKRINADDQEKLINWGYAVCDAAMRTHVDGNLPTPSGFPYPMGV
jgi:NTE family protein